MVWKNWRNAWWFVIEIPLLVFWKLRANVFGLGVNPNWNGSSNWACHNMNLIFLTSSSLVSLAQQSLAEKWTLFVSSVLERASRAWQWLYSLIASCKCRRSLRTIRTSNFMKHLFDCLNVASGTLIQNTQRRTIVAHKYWFTRLRNSRRVIFRPSDNSFSFDSLNEV